MDTVVLLPHLLVPVRPRFHKLEQTAVVIRGDRIIAVLPEDDALARYADARRI